MTAPPAINIDPTAVKHAQKEAEKKFSHLSVEEWRYLRRRAKTDLFLLGYGVLGYKKMSPRFHGHLCNWLQLTVAEQFREVLLPRSHLKTSVVTKADSIQIVLTDDVGDQPWPRNLGPNARVLLAHEAHEGGSVRFLQEITNHFLSNPTLMGLFPELVPNLKTQRVNRYELELPRTELWGEPTFDTIGVGGRSQGRHYNHIKADDLIGDKARDSAVEMQSAKEWFDNLQAFLVSLITDHIDVIGTRWAFDDLYAHIHRVYGDKIKKYIRAVIEVNSEGNREPIWPEEFTEDSLVILRKNRRVWTAQYINDPREGATEFDPSWKRHFYWAGRDKIATFTANNTQTTVDVRDLDVTILFDPAMGKKQGTRRSSTTGNSGFLVTGVDTKNRVFILDAVKANWQPPKWVDYLFRSVIRWRPRLVGIEAVNFSGLFMHWLPREMMIRGLRFNIFPLETRQREKDVRIRGLSNYFAAGQIFWPENFDDFTEEFERFGASDDIHLLDALAYGPEVWRPGLSKEQWDSYRKAEEELLNERDNETGYSVI